ncbi:MAG: decarboxylating 6-phosphogluconate dehydrogenase [Candidatus Riflebacteria bacterium]|nr:decarboxylating 6-phosphogluconate dehydrogenase [Candidatus Riflebacteria bacterium]
MKIGFIGLGKMGLNMVRRLRLNDHGIVCTARTTSKKDTVEKAGCTWAHSIKEMVSMLPEPVCIWVMTPSGDATEETLLSLAENLPPESIVVDGGNSRFTDTIRRQKYMSEKNIEFIDCGTSGGIWGFERGYCLMIGGNKNSVEKLNPIFSSLSNKGGFMHVGKTGSGHYVKMVHNAIEYGMMQAYAEGFSLLNKQLPDLNLENVCNLWNNGSVVKSWLLELSEKLFHSETSLNEIKPWVEDSGECRWAIEDAIDKSIPVPVIASSLFARFSSRSEDDFSSRFLAALRNQFGGHEVKTEKK